MAAASCPPTDLLNMCVADFLGLSTEGQIAQAAADVVKRIGCGSCGPRGFYGTFIEHLKLEQELAKFMGTEEALIYPSGSVTASSVVPAMLTQSDIAIVDEGVGRGILQGLQLAKCTVRYFKHCNAEDAERLLASPEAQRCQRRWLITEGVFGRTGRMAPLPWLSALREKHRCRLILDESFSFMALGSSGRGLTEHYGLSAAADVDVICASLENGCCSAAGFVTGKKCVISWQRLLGAGYVFSASLPPYLAVSAIEALNIAIAEPKRLEHLAKRSDELWHQLAAIESLVCTSTPGSPVLVMQLAAAYCSNTVQQQLLKDVAQLALASGVAVNYFEAGQDAKPALRLLVSSRLSASDVEKASQVLMQAVQQVQPMLQQLEDEARAAKQQLEDEALAAKEWEFENLQACLDVDENEYQGLVGAFEALKEPTWEGNSIVEGPLMMLLLPTMFWIALFYMVDIPKFAQVMLILCVALGYFVRSSTDSHGLRAKKGKQLKGK
eukprot:gnl/TRDRNA2_/TRDRNA2_113610_c1_seq1.p1 gnl/TRDRNA2_/TRDRNA2_113610_c1~~gnl/TRDRNA2_/TRDRNA2_113610_c1_seq1.p1  ORF type:complete len:504 (+),score=137.87 gnl/TRDRNA2_/TRDRNA2_113610_c1_seq1:24-1514(+)